MPLRDSRSARAIAPLLTCTLLLSSTPAAAQAATPLDRFLPAPAGDALFTVSSASVRGALLPAAALTVGYAHRPLVLTGERDGADSIAWVDRQLLLHVLAGVELFETVKIDLHAPFTLHQGGTAGTIAATSVAPPSGAAAGDIRLGGRAAVLEQDGLLPGAALGISVWLPSGDDGAFSGAESTRFLPSVIVGADHDRFCWSAFLGARFQEASGASLTGSEVLGGAGATLRLGAVQVGPEIALAASTGGATAVPVRSHVGVEALLGARYALGPLTFGAGGGPGLGRLPGTPAFRLFASVGFRGDPVDSAFRASRADAETDADKPVAGTGASRPPPPAAPPDRDGDEVPDAEDACPALVGDASPAAARRGCPPDRDGDGIFDVDDRCPDVPGSASADPVKHGCPPDTDGDGLPDGTDACPNEKGKPTDDPKTSGCPVAVRVEGEQIVILQQVQFETGRAEIRPESFDLLGQVAAVMKDHPDIARVAVDGHTDNVGAEKKNLDLSRRRALAVERWLVEHGVDARRLETRGFGPRRPIADNGTPAGKAQNRRVEFQIRLRTPNGEAGWVDGPVD